MVVQIHDQYICSCTTLKTFLGLQSGLGYEMQSIIIVFNMQAPQDSVIAWGFFYGE